MATMEEMRDRAWTEEEVAAIRDGAELMWNAWQWEWDNPDPIAVMWDELDEATQVAFVNLLGKTIRYVEVVTRAEDRHGEVGGGTDGGGAGDAGGDASERAAGG